MRGKAVCNCQGLGALPGVELCFPSRSVVHFIGSSQARWFAERFFPLTPALSLRRGRTVRRAFANPERLDSSQGGMRYSLSLRETENRTPRFRQSRAPRLVTRRDAVFPLPQGEGQ